MSTFYTLDSHKTHPQPTMGMVSTWVYSQVWVTPLTWPKHGGTTLGWFSLAFILAYTASKKSVDSPLSFSLRHHPKLLLLSRSQLPSLLVMLKGHNKLCGRYKVHHNIKWLCCECDCLLEDADDPDVCCVWTRASDIALLVTSRLWKRYPTMPSPMHSPLCVLEPTYMASMVVVQVRTSTWCRRAWCHMLWLLFTKMFWQKHLQCSFTSFARKFPPLCHAGGNCRCFPSYMPANILVCFSSWSCLSTHMHAGCLIHRMTTLWATPQTLMQNQLRSFVIYLRYYFALRPGTSWMQFQRKIDSGRVS